MIREYRLTALAILVALGLYGCATRPADLDLSLEKASAAGMYRVVLEPPATAPAVKQIHSWTVKLADSAGSPVRAAAFTVGGGMPQHGHGFPTKPRITREVAPGTYLLEGMKFSMTGWWEIKLGIQGPQGDDTITFNTVVETPRKAS